jgi:hypothetical protein
MENATMRHSGKGQECRKDKAVRMVGFALLALTGCGDANTNDSRGYTKAPLENPGVLIRAEGSSAMDSLGSPILPRDTVIPVNAAVAPPAAQPKR